MKQTFDKENYRLAKQEVIELIKNKPYWVNAHGKGVTFDGIYDVENFNSQSLKILLVLSESYGHNEFGAVDIEKNNEMHRINVTEKNIPTLRNTAKLLWLIFTSLDENRELSINEFQPKDLFETLMKTAWVNVKKISNPNSNGIQNPKTVYLHAIENKAILEKQFISIAPDLIILFGTPVINSVCNMKLFGGYLKKSKQVIQENNGQKIICLSHPSARFGRPWSNKKIFEYYKIIYNGIKQL